MKLPTDYENLLKHVVDGFNRNFFRNEFKEQFKIIEKTQGRLEDLEESLIDQKNSIARIEQKSYLKTINTAQASIKTIQKGLIECLTNQLEEAKKQLIAIQSTTPKKEN